jgi:hypothetical protein
MRKLRIPMLGCLVVIALAGALAACSQSDSGPDSTNGMIGGKGADYNKD